MPASFLIRHPGARSQLLERIAALDLSRAWEVTIQPHVARRSLGQNARYWTLLTAAAAECGHSVDELHDIAKAQFLGYEQVAFRGHVASRLRSTAKLTRPDFDDYVVRVEAWLFAELGLDLREWTSDEHSAADAG